MSGNRLRMALLVGLGAAAGFSSQGAAAGEQRSVVELFTSQGCSSCPPADAVAGRLSTDPALVVLSFHVNYWDSLGWKDPFSSQISTDRQYSYGKSLGERSVFTPQLIVNGTQSVVGSQEGNVLKAVAATRQNAFPVQADLSRQPDGSFNLSLAGPTVDAEIWEVRYVRHAVTSIGGGENGGRSLETFNNVTAIHRVGAFEPGVIKLQPLRKPEDGLAVLVQTPGEGKMLGAAAAY